MYDIIMVPVHLDGFFLTQEQLVTEAFANFRRLPFSSSDKDNNPDTANISESVLSVPFQNNNLNLQKGLHLHWSLPDGLTKGTANGTANDYPVVPNRWLVTRKQGGTTQKQWIIESDYLHPQGQENTYRSIVFPIETDSGQPFRYMGRQLDYSGWQEKTADRLGRLTAIGYGEPSFAAFYPDCHSVFGCFDADITRQDQLAGLSYQLIGWYKLYKYGDKDPLKQLIDANASADKATLKEAVKNQFGRALTIDVSNKPKGLVCYANLEFNPNINISNSKKASPATVSLGNTGTEALSAYLATELNSIKSNAANKLKLEEQLENLLLQTGLENRARPGAAL